MPATTTRLPTPTNAVGILCALGAWFLFSLNDAGIKLLSNEYALHQIVLIRSVVALIITLTILMPVEGGYSLIKTKHPFIHMVRGLCIVVANVAFFMGLATISLPEATAIFFIAPLFITALSVIFLGEQVGIRRWIAVSVGLLGVIIMLRPGAGTFRYAALLPLFSAFAYACMQILTRKLGLKERASTLAFYIQLMFVVVSSVFGLLFGHGKYANPDNASMDFLFRAWTMPNFRDALIMLGIGLASGLGGYLIGQAYRRCQAATIAPFEYVALVLAIIWGITLWGEWPDAFAWLGILMILGSGLFVFWREVMLDRKFVIKHPMPRNR